VRSVYNVFRQLIAADTHKRLRLVYPAASRTAHVLTFVHSKVMIVDDTLVRIGSANFSRRSMAVDSECDVAVDATAQTDARAGIRHIRDRLLAEHVGLTTEAVAGGIERAGSLRTFIDSRQLAGITTLARIEIPPEEEVTASEAARALADPEEPIAFRINRRKRLVPAADATNGLRPVPVPDDSDRRAGECAGVAVLRRHLAPGVPLRFRKCWPCFLACRQSAGRSRR
jgi:hypothetical protein